MLPPLMASEGDVTVLTGATGFVGSMVLERLLARRTPVVALVRAADHAAARVRLDELAVRTWGDAAIVAGVTVLAADVESDGLGLDSGVFDALAERACSVVHCAASVRFDLSPADAQAINVGGTERVVGLAARARALGADGRFVHVSTAYVHGRAEGSLLEEAGPFEVPPFRNTYELTKHAAEQVVMGLDGAAIVRPSIVVGDSETGWTSSFNVVYPGVRGLLKGWLDVVPAPADAILDLVPVDQVVDVVCGLLDEPAMGGVVQAVSGELAPTMEQFARLVYEHAGMEMRPCVPTASDQIGVYAPYVDVWSRFEFARAEGLGVRRVTIEDLVPRLLDHAEAARWGRRVVLRPSPVAEAAAA